MFEVGFFPETFKLAHITSIWKQKGLKSSKLFYRPISLLPTIAKIMESIHTNCLRNHIWTYKMLEAHRGADERAVVTKMVLV